LRYSVGVVEGTSVGMCDSGGVAICNAVGESEGTFVGAFFVVDGHYTFFDVPYTSTSERSMFASTPEICTKDPSMSSKVKVKVRTSVEFPIVSAATTAKVSFRI